MLEDTNSLDGAQFYIVRTFKIIHECPIISLSTGLVSSTSIFFSIRFKKILTAVSRDRETERVWPNKLTSTRNYPVKVLM